jgi:site-specific recombinase XerD
MARAPATVSLASGDIGLNAASFARHLRASNLTPETIRTYLASVDRLATFLETRGMPTEVAALRREHVESFIEDQLANWKPTTAANRYSGIQAFFKWLVDEGEIRESPMARMRKPKLPEAPPPVLSEDQLKAVLAACDGQNFEERRDMALVRLFLGTGARLSEIANLRWAPDDETSNDVDLDMGIIRVVGKGRRERAVYVGTKAVKALDRYLRARDRHKYAALPWLWLGPKGRLTDSGIAQVVRRRGRMAGMGDRLHPHLFRHRYAHAALSGGMQEGDVMMLAGWRSREMLSRYARAAAADRAIAAARRFNPGDAL